MQRCSNYRKLTTQQLEGRCLMAGDLSHNFLEPNDVNDDNRISPVDALMVINTLNDLRSGANSSSSTVSKFEDVNDDSKVSPTDALLVINQLTANRSQASSGSSNSSTAQIETRMQSTTSSAAAKIEFEQSGPEMELSIKLRDAVPSTTYAVHLNDFALGDLVTDSKGRGLLKFASGDDSHLAWPDNMPQLTVDTELIIGDIVRAKLSGASLDDNSDSSGDDSSNSGDNSNDSGDDSNDPSQQSGQWMAIFSSVGSFTRKAEFEQESEGGTVKSKLEVEIEGAAPDTSYAIIVAGVSLGNVQTNSRGKVKAIWSSDPTESEQPLPSEFPTIAVGTTITIGDADASFQ